MLNNSSVVVCFGDSLTALGQWPDQLHVRFGATFINSGVGGHTCLQGLARFERDVVDHHPDAVIIGFGTNDQVIYDPIIGPQVSLETYKSTMATFIERVRDMGAQPFLLTSCVVDSDAYYSRHPQEWCDPYGGMQALLETYRHAVRELAAEYDVPLVDIAAKSSTCKDEVLGTPDQDDFDGVHPSAHGFSLFADWIGDALAPFFG